MKVRTGFVSNSSSSSFCIFGTMLEGQQIEDLINNLNPKKHTCDKDETTGCEACDYYSNTDDWEIVEEALVKNSDLAVFKDSNNGTLFIGRPWASIGDKETGKEFKDSVRAELKELIGKRTACETYEEVINS